MSLKNISQIQSKWKQNEIDMNVNIKYRFVKNLGERRKRPEDWESFEMP